MDSLDDKVEQKLYWINKTRSTNLYLDNMRIHTLPDSITEIHSLESLYLRGNFLKELPEEIGQLRKLQKIYLDNNNIFTLPESFVELEGLQVLFANNNELMALPDEIGNLKSLERVSLTGNKLKFLPNSMKRLTRLRQLYLNNNLLQDIDVQIFGLQNLNVLDTRNNSSIGDLSRRYDSDDLSEIFEERSKQNMEKEAVLKDNQIFHQIMKTIQQVRENIPLTLVRLAELADTNKDDAEVKLKTILDTQIDLGEYLPLEQVFIKSTQITEMTIKTFSKGSVDALQKCEKCGDTQSILINQCRNCGHDLEYCNMCKKGFTDKDVKNMCPSCNNNFHRTHIIAYVQSMGKCPVCKNKLTLAHFS